MPAFQDITGFRFGRLTVVSRVKAKDTPRWLCHCDCGTKHIVAGRNLKHGRTVSCGCHRREATRARRAITPNPRTTHGLSKTKNYDRWLNMIYRCEKPTHQRYYLYGARGITVCERWRNSYEAFLADMGEPPSPKMSIDRIDNDRGYEPANCRWATQSEQIKNRRHSVA